MYPELCLGTAQFGLDYGITNKNGQVSQEEIQKILQNALSNKILYLDTAQNYGDAEKRIGKTNLIKNHFKIISKFSNLSNLEDTYERLKSWQIGLNKSLDNLGISKLDGFMIHNKKDILGKDGPLIMKWMEDLKKESIVKSIGISIYDEEDIYQIPIEKFDLIQLPLSIYDQRFLKKGIINKLYSLGKKIYIRSIFLQGLILQDSSKWPNFLSKKFKKHHKKTEEKINKKNLSMLEEALGFAFSIEKIDAVLIGITNNNELSNILDILNSIKKNKKDYLHKELDLNWGIRKDIDPRQWPQN